MKKQTAAEDAAPVVVYLGNHQAIEAAASEDGTVRIPLPGKRCTTVSVAPGLTLMEAAHDITHPGQGVWQAHSDADAPAWVASTDPALGQLLAAHWNCELREPQPGGEE
jgi:hypothetical protein